ncbi:MAG TPA: alpha/beta hydrolase fold domain-containing protein [Capillimicrobium sp.]|nr:alpha/beta hydrolase fold domain-containing protein [Capillimicrobium sp.]
MTTRAGLAGLAAALALALPGCGGGDGGATVATTVTAPATTTGPSPATSTPVTGIERLDVGNGARSAVVFRPRGGPQPPPGVLFLHGWGGVDPTYYRAWIRHLVRQGNEVIYPRYQTGAVSLPGLALPNAIAGTRAALRRAPIAPGSLVVAGHSAGGAMAADYAAVAAGRGLPPARAVFAIYPGRRLKGVPLGIPEVDPARIPAGTQLLALAGARDTVVGAATARRTVARATRVPASAKRFVLVRDPRVSEHLAPLSPRPAARRTFWAPLDRLIVRARAR